MDEWLGFFQTHQEELSQLNFPQEDQTLCLEYALTLESTNNLHRGIQNTKLAHLWELRDLMKELTEDRTPSVDLAFEQDRANAGSFGRGFLALNPEDLLTLPQGPADLIDTCLHELIHNEQNTLMLRSVIDDLESSGRDITYDNIRSEFQALSGSNVSNEYIDKVFALRDGPLSSEAFEYAQKVLGPAFSETRNAGEDYHRSSDTFRALSNLEKSLTGTQPDQVLEDLFYAINQDDPFGAKLFGAEFMSGDESTNLALRFDYLRNQYLAADGDPSLLEPVLEQTISMIDSAKRNINEWRENTWSEYAGKDHELDAWVGGFLTTIEPAQLAEAYQEAGQVGDVPLLSIPTDVALPDDSTTTAGDSDDSTSSRKNARTLAKLAPDNSSDSVTILEPQSDNPNAWLPDKPIAERTPEELNALRSKLGKLLSPLAAPEVVNRFVSKLFEITSSWDSDPALSNLSTERDALINEMNGLKDILRSHALLNKLGAPVEDLASYADEAELPALPEIERRYTEIESLLDPNRRPEGPQAMLDAAREPRRLALEQAVNELLGKREPSELTIVLKTSSQLGNVAAQLDGLNLEINGDLLDSSSSIDRIANRILHKAVHKEQDALLFAKAARDLGFSKDSLPTRRDLFSIADRMQEDTGREFDIQTLKKLAENGIPDLTDDQITRAQSLARDYLNSSDTFHSAKEVFETTDISLEVCRQALESLVDAEGNPDPDGVLYLLNQILGSRSETQLETICQDLFGQADFPQPVQELVDIWLSDYVQAESIVKMRLSEHDPEFDSKVMELFNNLLDSNTKLPTDDNAEVLVAEIRNGIETHNDARKAAWEAYFTSLPEEDAVVAGASASNKAQDVLLDNLFGANSNQSTENSSPDILSDLFSPTTSNKTPSALEEVDIDTMFSNPEEPSVSDDGSDTSSDFNNEPDSPDSDHDPLYRQKGQHSDDWRAPGEPKDFDQLTEQQIIEAFEGVPDSYRLRDPALIRQLVDILRNEVFPAWDATDVSFFRAMGELDEAAQSSDILYLRSRLNEVSARYQEALGAPDPEVPIKLEEAYCNTFDQLLTKKLADYDQALQGQLSPEQETELTAARKQAQADLDLVRQFQAARKEVGLAQTAFKQIEAERLRILNNAISNFVREQLGVPDVPFLLGSDSEGEFRVDGISIDREYLAFHKNRGDAVNTIAHELSHDEQLALRMRAAQEDAVSPLKPSKLAEQVLDYTDKPSAKYAKDAIDLGGSRGLSDTDIELAERLQQEYADMDVSDPEEMATAANLLRTLEVTVADLEQGNDQYVVKSIVSRDANLRNFWNDVFNRAEPKQRVELNTLVKGIRTALNAGEVVPPERLNRLRVVLESVKSIVKDDLQIEWETYTDTETEIHSSAIGDYAQHLFEALEDGGDNE